MNVQKLIDKVSDENLEKSLLKESSDGEVTIFKLPSENYAVPILDLFTSANSEDFVHVRALKCSLDNCARKTKSKKHTLVEKGVPMCPHSMLGEKQWKYPLAPRSRVSERCTLRLIPHRHYWDYYWDFFGAHAGEGTNKKKSDQSSHPFRQDLAHYVYSIKT